MAFTFEGIEYEYKVSTDAIQKRERGERRWQPCSKASLLSFAADSPLWDWLRSQGVKRPSPAGGEEGRTTTPVLLRLDPKVAKDLDALAREDGTTKSAAVRTLVTRETERRRK